MSLVAYEASSDSEESSSEENTIADIKLSCEKQNTIVNSNHQNNIPKAKPNASKNQTLGDDSDLSENIKSVDLNATLFKKLPAPKSIYNLDIEEEDDEFLRKKATPVITEKRPKGPVQITIPSLSEFKDVENDMNERKTKPSTDLKGRKGCGLLGILPKPKQETFIKTESTSSTANESKRIVNKAKLIPDSVKNKLQSTQKLINKQKSQSILNSKDDCSDDSDVEGEDFFSLQTDNKDKLPEISMNEINAMVAKRAAKMAKSAAQIEESLSSSINQSDLPVEVTSLPQSVNDNSSRVNVDVDEKALHALVGSRAKRRKMEEVNVVELSSAEVLPNKDEWLRTALASSTQYQPIGVLKDEELAPGTRKKHQITYLAHQAKSNELELQAMWSANRHTRRQTQSKYGF